MSKSRRGGSARLLVTLSFLSALGIILGKYLAFNITEFMRFSLENITIIFTGIVFGPILGFAVGAVQDIVGCIAVGYTINPIITLGSAAIGLVSGYIFRLFRRLSYPLPTVLSVLCSHAVGSVLIKSTGLAIFYSLPFGATVMWRILNYVIVGALEAIILTFLFKSKQLLSQINKITTFSPYGKFESVSDATAYAKSVSGVFSKPGLERVTDILSALGNPQHSVKVVHVTGTNGKGSFSAMLSSILKASGLKVGSFNSPYLYEARESIRIDGEPISEGEFISLLDRLTHIADKMEDKPTEFELLTAAAYLFFKESAVDVAVIECGMGGGKDATNVINSPLLSVITGVSVDHTSYLGDTVEKIAREKAGIIKNGSPLLIGKCDGETLAVIEEVARSLNAPTTVCTSPAHATKMTLNGSLISCDGIDDLHLPLLGTHQLYNAALAIKASILLRGQFPSLTDVAIKDGLAGTKWSGRFEILSRDPICIFDGAHNLDGIHSAVQSIKAYFSGKVICLTGVLRDKEYEAMADALSEVVSHAVTVTPDNPRALDAKDYAKALSERNISVEVANSVTAGVKTALHLAKQESTAVVCLGSLYLYREVSEAVKFIISTDFDN